MTTVNTTTTPTTGNPGNLRTSPAFTAFSRIIRGRIAIAPPKHDPLQRQQAIENALSTALWHIRKDSSPASIQRATGRAIRAASMLKQACADLNAQGVEA